ncbi:hypothetical protein OSB04_016587 [Centaurea solstitialis]|uniref:Uncharacterized protein n=1 Tax=Centaurea solstitialis TaxID=347529 RepID=A0AA38W9Y1_9ASTR|nr:hypothetical protein OSB04_016587 [Centaurea solstitialis]
MKTQLADFGYTMQKIPIYCDSKIQHSRTKHSDIRYHFIKDHVEKGNIELYFVESDLQLADLFTKPFDEKRHFLLLSKLGMLDLPPEIRTRAKSNPGVTRLIPEENIQVLEAVERKSTEKGRKAWKLSKVNSEGFLRPRVIKSGAAKRATSRMFILFTDFTSTLEFFTPQCRQRPSMEDSRTCLKRKYRVI